MGSCGYRCVLFAALSQRTLTCVYRLEMDDDTQHMSSPTLANAFLQYVSSTPATRLDVINLQEKLDQQLQQRQAREVGVCWTQWLYTEGRNARTACSISHNLALKYCS